MMNKEGGVPQQWLPYKAKILRLNMQGMLAKTKVHANILVYISCIDFTLPPLKFSHKLSVVGYQLKRKKKKKINVIFPSV